MARRKELRGCRFYITDGFSGTGAVDDSSIANNDTTLGVDTLDLHDDVTIVPVGARFKTAGINTIRTVTAQNNSMVWLVTVDATSGNFTITFEGQTTGSIAENADAATVQTALVALSNVASGDLVVTGSAGGPYTITAAGDYANDSGLVMTVSDVDLSGGGSDVTISTEQDGLSTWQLTFTPALVTGSLPSDDHVITFLPARIEMKIGSGNVEWTETDEPIFDYDRDLLDGTRAGREQPMEVSAAFVFDFLRASSGGSITPYEALHRIGGAAAWHSAGETACDPYCVDIVIEDIPTCGSEQAEVITFEQFYKTTVNPSFEGGLVNLRGRCAKTKPTIERLAVAVVEGE